MNLFARQILSGSRTVCFSALAGGMLLSAMPVSAQIDAAPTQTASQTQTPAAESKSDPVLFEELKDATVHDDALMLLAKHIAIEPVWTSLRIGGSAALSGQEAAVPAQLLLQNQNQAILKLQQSSGLTAIAVEGAFRRSSYADGTSSVDPYATGPASLLPLQLLHSSDLISRLLALKIGTAQVVNGIRCDKLSLRYILTKVKPPEGKLPHNVQVDFYLDAATHLLVRSVVSVKIPGLMQNQLQTTTYSGYKNFGLLFFPQNITQTIGDMPLWNLAISSVSAEAKIDSKEFIAK